MLYQDQMKRSFIYDFNKKHRSLLSKTKKKTLNQNRNILKVTQLNASRARIYIYPISPTIYVISERDNTTGKRRVFDANMYKREGGRALFYMGGVYIIYISI